MRLCQLELPRDLADVFIVDSANYDQCRETRNQLQVFHQLYKFGFAWTCSF